jgi:DNA-binding NtrC family response regulator
VAAGRFRADLLYRLDVVSVYLPPLRQRSDDIPVLTDHFIRRYFRDRSVPAISPAVREAFQRYRWPGNVRELENACERIAQTCSCPEVRCGCMPGTILFHTGDLGPPGTWTDRPAPSSIGVYLDGRLRDVEASLIAWAMRASRGNKSKAADLLTISRSTLFDRIRRLQRFSGTPEGTSHETRV